MNALNEALIAEYESNDGRISGPYAGADILLLHTRGARSNSARVSPVTFRQEGAAYFVFASFAGSDHHPAWYYNLLTHPLARVQVMAETFDVLARVTEDAERDGLYLRHAAKYPLFVGYERKTSRRIPVVALTRTTSTAS